MRLAARRGTASEGVLLYAARCAACHVESGEGSPGGDALVGRRPKDAFDYTRRAMPFDRPGSLQDDEVHALVAWLLWQNGIIAPDARMDAATLPAVRMPARDRFVADDRETSPVVR